MVYSSQLLTTISRNMELEDTDNPRNLSYEEVLDILEEEMYQEASEENPYKPLNFNDED